MLKVNLLDPSDKQYLKAVFADETTVASKHTLDMLDNALRNIGLSEEFIEDLKKGFYEARLKTKKFESINLEPLGGAMDNVIYPIAEDGNWRKRDVYDFRRREIERYTSMIDERLNLLLPGWKYKPHGKVPAIITKVLNDKDIDKNTQRRFINMVVYIMKHTLEYDQGLPYVHYEKEFYQRVLLSGEKKGKLVDCPYVIFKLNVDKGITYQDIAQELSTQGDRLKEISERTVRQVIKAFEGILFEKIGTRTGKGSGGAAIYAVGYWSSYKDKEGKDQDNRMYFFAEGKRQDKILAKLRVISWH